MRLPLPALLLGLTLLSCDAPQQLGADHDNDAHDHAGHEAHGEDADNLHARTNDEEPTHTDHAEEEGIVHLSGEAIARSNIRVGIAASGSLQDTLDVPAEIELDPDAVAHINPLLEGLLVEVNVSLGDRVTPNQPLATQRSVELGQARAELARATALRDVAKQTRDRQDQLRAEGINSARHQAEAQLALDQARAERDAARSKLRVYGARAGRGSDLSITSPIAGEIIERHATRGESVSPEDTLFIVADLSKVWIIGDVYEQSISRVTEGMNATLTLDAYPGRSWRGRVDHIGAQLDEATRTLPVRVELDNPDGTLRPGLFGTLRLTTPHATAGTSTLVPLDAVQTLDNQTVVFVPGPAPDTFEARAVTIGRQNKQTAELSDGLSAGAPFVTSGAFILKSELIRSQLGHGHAH